MSIFNQLFLRPLWALLPILLMIACSSNPPINSVISAHGNMDWHVDTAQEFLFGTDMDGVVSAANHCPDTWSRGHIHFGMMDTSRFYHDSDLVTPGDDSDVVNGIDRTMLFFYAGHGSPTSWDTLGDHATQSSMKLAEWDLFDQENSGRLRYYWQCSCQVFAHGPRDCTDATHAYACPDDFDGSADTVDMRNIYERWGPALGKRLRMACGASTSAYCHESQMNRIWNNYNNLGMDVADAFIDGLHGGSWVVPLCITQGGWDVTATPLYDAVFTNSANDAGTSVYHIQYLSEFASNPELIPMPLVPELLPILELRPRPIPERYRKLVLKTPGPVLRSEAVTKDGRPLVRIDTRSGAIYLSGDRQRPADAEPMNEEKYFEKAIGFMKEKGLYEEENAEIRGNRFMVDSRPAEKPDSQVIRHQKNARVTLQRMIKVGDYKVNVLGEGGRLLIQMNNDGSIINASIVWREIKAHKAMTPIKRKEEALREAMDKMENPDAYKLNNWRWGYKAQAGNVEQAEMRITFRFEFMPKNPEELRQYPPQMIEIDGHKR